MAREAPVHKGDFGSLIARPMKQELHTVTHRSSQIAMGVLLFWSACLLGGEGTSVPRGKVRKVPSNFEFVTPSEVADLHPVWRDELLWPTDGQINEKKASADKARVRKALDNTMRWLSLVLRDAWLPRRSDVELLPLKASINGNDAVRVRYAIQDYVFQVTSISPSIAVVIVDTRQTGAKRGVDENAAKAQVSSVVDKFFRKAGEIKAHSMSRIKKNAHGLEGHSTSTGAPPRSWWEWTHWWTNGKSVMVVASKFEPGPYAPALHKNWFSGR